MGGGHLSAARALAAELEATGQFATRLVDVYVECGRWPVSQFPWIYGALARQHARLWWLIYRASSRRLNPSWILRPFLRRGVLERVQDEQPDLIVSVLPAVNGLLVEAAGRVGAHFEVVLTDWDSVHPYWVARGVAHYTAPTDSARRDCIGFGAPAGAVDVVGIPVRREFGQSESSRARSEQFVILAMVGAEGSPRALRNLAALAGGGLDAELVVVCGRSDDLRAQVEQLRSRTPMRVLGFVEDVASLMRGADLLVTKAGGVTLAEAFCSGVPVVIHDVLPGQEAGNLKYVVTHGAVAYASTPRRLLQTVRELIADPVARERLQRWSVKLARPDAARAIAANIARRLDAPRA